MTSGVFHPGGRLRQSGWISKSLDLLPFGRDYGKADPDIVLRH